MSEFKDTQNRWLTLGLFYELNNYNKRFARFTVNDEDKILDDGTELKSIKKLYLSCNDPTEYEFATEHLGGWAHWRELQECKPLQNYIEQWREELEVRIRSEALQGIIDRARGKQGYQAELFLVNRGWSLRKAGAPSKEEKAGATKRERAFNSTVSADAERLGLKVVE